MSVRGAFLALLVLALSFQAHAAVSRVSDSTTTLVDSLSLSDMASDAVAAHAVEMAERAGLTNEAAIAADEALDWQLLEEDAERLRLKNLGAAIRQVSNNVKASVQQAVSQIKASAQQTTHRVTDTVHRQAASAPAQQVAAKVQVHQAVSQIKASVQQTTHRVTDSVQRQAASAPAQQVAAKVQVHQATHKVKATYKVKAGLKKIGAKIKTSVQQTIAKVKASVQQTTHKVKNGVQKIKADVKKVGETAKQVGAKIKEGVKKVGANVKQIGSKIKAGVKKAGEKAKQVGAKIKTGVKKVGAKVKKIGSKIKTGVKKVGAKVKKIGAKIKKVLAGPADSTGVPAEEHTTLLRIADGLYELSLSAGGRHSFSYKGSCVPATVIATYNRNNFLVWVLHVPALRAVVIGFRGTVNKENIASDLDIKKISCQLGSLSCGSAHRGFYRLWAGIRSSVITTVNSFLAKHPSVTAVYPIGHSLGAAVAVIAGLDLANVYSARTSTSIKVKVVGWGVPRVGNGVFASKFGAFPSLSVLRYRQWQKYMQIAKQWDPVSLIPPAGWGFSQVGAEFPITCKTCSTWVSVHKIVNYQKSFVRLQGRGIANC